MPGTVKREETGRKINELSAAEYAVIFKYANKNNMRNISPVEEHELPDFGRKETPRYGILCGAGRSSFNVNWKGRLTACDNLKSLEVSLKEKSFEEAWNLIHSEALSYPLAYSHFPRP